MKTLEQLLQEGLIAPGVPFKLKQTIEMHLSEGQKESLEESFTKIKLSESTGTSSKRKLIVTVEGIHTGMTKNKTFYPGGTLEESVPSWTTPHHKPVLKNHDEYSDPLGRVVFAEYVESVLTDKFTVRMKLEITDEQTIQRILDKRYLTLSVGGSANKVVCSVCAKDLVKEGYCGHRRGNTYEGKEAYWMIGNYTGDEISFVNMPADVHAQIISAEIVSGEGGSNVPKQKNHTEDDTKTSPVSTTESDDGASTIDNILNVNENDGKEENPIGADPESPKDPEPVKTEESEDNDDKAKDAEIADLTSRLETSEANALTLEVSLAEAKEEANRLKAELAVAEEDCRRQVESNKTLARYARKTLIERAVDLKSMSVEESERTQIRQEFENKNSKVLEGIIDDLVKNIPVQRQREQVENPGLAYEEEPIKKTTESSTTQPPLRKLQDFFM